MNHALVDKMLEFFSTSGWRQKASGAPDRRLCLLTALSMAIDETVPREVSFVTYVTNKEELNSLAEYLFPHRIDSSSPVERSAQFNDHPETVFADVEQLLTKAKRVFKPSVGYKFVDAEGYLVDAEGNIATLVLDA